MAAPMKNKMLISSKFLVLLLIIGLLSITVCGEDDQSSCSKPDGATGDEKSCGCGALNRKNVEKSGENLNQDGDDSSAAAVEDEDVEQGEADHDKVKYSGAKNSPVFRRTNQMVLINGGEFLMGTDKPLFPQDGEGPARRTKIGSFYVDIHEVSNAEFQLFTKDTGYVTEVLTMKLTPL